MKNIQILIIAVKSFKSISGHIKKSWCAEEKTSLENLLCRPCENNFPSVRIQAKSIKSHFVGLVGLDKVQEVNCLPMRNCNKSIIRINEDHLGPIFQGNPEEYSNSLFVLKSRR